ncbi:hypothetical protein KIN20_034996 [Parelaphostrongylus tenuis]|uniref:Uncharacterized protein n=1 Tax=Parelaphostrongylus tenuis TaxID=148309 RepID=A0AAD5RAH1_PARTN|nr:hypothetical protein KIN20_034996 [Parelaphostrongylus tenuis]
MFERAGSLPMYIGRENFGYVQLIINSSSSRVFDGVISLSMWRMAIEWITGVPVSSMQPQTNSAKLFS